MIRIINKVRFDPHTNRMNKTGNIRNAIDSFNQRKNKNLYFLLKKRYEWMKKFIKEDDIGLEVGAGAGFSKEFILNKNFKISDLADYDHLDHKNIDSQNTKLADSSYDFIIASNMVHHVPFPNKFFREMYRLLKPGGKLIIQEAYCSIVFQIITIIMRHEGFDFTKNVWSEKEPMSDTNDIWAGNIAVPHLVFDDQIKFEEKLGSKFKIRHQKIYECLVFLNSGGVSSKTFYIPLNDFFLKLLNILDKILVGLLPKFFGMGRQIILEKI